MQNVIVRERGEEEVDKPLMLYVLKTPRKHEREGSKCFDREI